MCTFEESTGGERITPPLAVQVNGPGDHRYYTETVKDDPDDNEGGVRGQSGTLYGRGFGSGVGLSSEETETIRRFLIN